MTQGAPPSLGIITPRWIRSTNLHTCTEDLRPLLDHHWPPWLAWMSSTMLITSVVVCPPRCLHWPRWSYSHSEGCDSERCGSFSSGIEVGRSFSPSQISALKATVSWRRVSISYVHDLQKAEENRYLLSFICFQQAVEPVQAFWKTCWPVEAILMITIQHI